MIIKINSTTVWWRDSENYIRTYSTKSIITEQKSNFLRLNKFKKIIYREIWKESSLKSSRDLALKNWGGLLKFNKKCIIKI